MGEIEHRSAAEEIVQQDIEPQVAGQMLLRHDEDAHEADHEYRHEGEHQPAHAYALLACRKSELLQNMDEPEHYPADNLRDRQDDARAEDDVVPLEETVQKIAESLGEEETADICNNQHAGHHGHPDLPPPAQHDYKKHGQQGQQQLVGQTQQPRQQRHRHMQQYENLNDPEVGQFLHTKTFQQYSAKDSKDSAKVPDLPTARAPARGTTRICGPSSREGHIPPRSSFRRTTTVPE